MRDKKPEVWVLALVAPIGAVWVRTEQGKGQRGLRNRHRCWSRRQGRKRLWNSRSRRENYRWDRIEWLLKNGGPSISRCRERAVLDSGNGGWWEMAGLTVCTIAGGWGEWAIAAKEWWEIAAGWLCAMDGTGWCGIWCDVLAIWMSIQVFALSVADYLNSCI